MKMTPELLNALKVWRKEYNDSFGDSEALDTLMEEFDTWCADNNIEVELE